MKSLPEKFRMLAVQAKAGRSSGRSIGQHSAHEARADGKARQSLRVAGPIRRRQTRSKIPAAPWPMPTHMVTMP
jgi:hypothetical protein